MKRIAVAALALLAAGCATVVKSHHLRPDWNVHGRNLVKHVNIVVSPLPDGNQKVGDLWGLMAARYVDMKRQFIVKDHPAVASLSDPKSQCGDGVDGVLWISPTMNRAGAGFETSAKMQLTECSTGATLWSTEGGGSWKSDDTLLSGEREHYAKEIGPEVEPYVAPAFNLMRPMLDYLPEVTLTESDKDEKAGATP